MRKQTVSSCLTACVVMGFATTGCVRPLTEPAPQSQSDALVLQPTAIDFKGEPVTLGASPAASGAILLNQYGFSPRARLRAAYVNSGHTPFAVSLVNDRGQTVLTGQTEPFGIDPVSGLPLHQIDMDPPRINGRNFRLRVGLSESHPFDLSDNLYGDLARDSLSYFYQSRLGEPVEAAYVPSRLPSLSRPAGHLNQTLGCFDGVDERGTNWPPCDYTLTVAGGWYDAGDYGQYVVNTGFATWMLLDMSERRKDQSGSQCATQFNDQTLSIPEAGNGIPDDMDEARRGVEYMLSMQISSTRPQAMARGVQPDTGPLSLSQVNPVGMVHHKSHGLTWPGDDVLPHTDTIPRRLYPPTTAATLHLAAIGAKCARVFAPYDPVFSDRCLTAARQAFTAAERVPDAYAWGEFTGGGPYADQSVSDEFGWAATELWLATGEANYADAMSRYIQSYNPNDSFFWASVEPLGLMSLDAAGAWSDNSAMVSARQALLGWANRIVDEADGTGFMIPYGSSDYYWGSNGEFMNRGVILGVAYRMTGDVRYSDAVNDSMDYILGRNPLGQSYITGYGEQSVTQPHHRFWRGALDASLPFPPPGILSGGPNNISFSDPVATLLRGQCQSMTCWVDDYGAYTMNEVAINWNASLAWVAHWLDRRDSVCVTRPQTHEGAE